MLLVCRPHSEWQESNKLGKGTKYEPWKSGNKLQISGDLSDGMQFIHLLCISVPLAVKEGGWCMSLRFFSTSKFRCV